MAPLFKFKDEDEVIGLANETEYGLAAYFYARDVGRVFKVAEALEAGIVGVNEGIFSTEVAPFGGFKHPASAARARSTASTSTSRSSTSTSAASGTPERSRPVHFDLPAWPGPRPAILLGGETLRPVFGTLSCR